MASTQATAVTAVLDEAPKYPAPIAHALLVALWLLSYFVEIPANLNVILHAALTVYAGCQRSVKPTPPTESMTTSDAMRFPIMGSIVLFSLFLVFKFLPKDLVNLVLTGYFGFLGTVALTFALVPFLEPSMPASVRSKAFSKRIKIPMVSEPLEFEGTLPEVLVGVPCAAFCLWYCITRHWLANNALGLAFAVEGIEYMALGSIKNGVILLSGLFVYDVFWVFCTPVMVSVAKSFDAPIKLLFVRGVTESGAPNFAMLGLGDIVIPGIFVALMLRYDTQCSVTGPKRYFNATFGGYVAGLVATIVVMNVFKAAQPALLYIVPALLAAAFALAAARGEVKHIYYWEEVPEAGEDDKPSEGAAEDKKSQ